MIELDGVESGSPFHSNLLGVLRGHIEDKASGFDENGVRSLRRIGQLASTNVNTSNQASLFLVSALSRL
jgi:hypothetical protein